MVAHRRHGRLGAKSPPRFFFAGLKHNLLESAIDRTADHSHVPRVLKRLTLALLTVASLLAANGAEPERSVIQIITFMQQPAWDAPWRFDTVRRAGGSGFVIKGKRIMTNAHVVAWARQIIVRKYQDPRPYVAEIEYVGNDCDLAVLSVQDATFFDNLQPLELGDLPQVRSTVVTCGYPVGGEEISYTRGVVSRIEIAPYSHIGNRQLLNVQTDAAINPGNSGGPVLQEDKVVGVAFQGIPGLENAGFFIPPPIIEHFLKDIEDKRYHGFPLAGIRMVHLQNPAYRAFLKMAQNDVGARVDSLLPIPSTIKVLKQDDVLLRAGGFPIASDGTILYQGNRVSAALAFHLAQHGDSVPIVVWRDGSEKELSLPVQIYEGDRAVGSQYDSLPRYFVYGGLVFTPLSLDYLKTLPGSPSDSPNADLVYELYYRRHEEPENTRPEPIVMASILPDEVNANVSSRGRALVDRINGVRIEKLEDAVRAFENNTGDFDRIDFLPLGTFETLERAKVAAAKQRILTTHSLPSDRRL